ncbi:MAG TPA: OFA family MFS transporter [Dictyobacter sp.]|jgi:OFA family oxalate/formate antiporter-like MFS transporter|nr:OFA family MFS transporter [Dictyobacter sp.]
MSSNTSVSSGSVPNRWIIAIAAFFLQVALGSVYAWSVFLKPVTALFYNVPATAVTSGQTANIGLNFSITLAALGITAGFGGWFNNRFGPRIVATAGGILYGIGIILAGLTASDHSAILLFLTYGVIGGIGIGLGYIVPLAMLIKWFPDRRGFITGLAVAGFGLGALVIAQTAPSMLKSLGVSTTFIILGIVYLIVVVGAAQTFRSAPEGYAPEGWTPSTTQQAVRAKRDFVLAEALKDGRWYLLWLTLALNVTAGAALIAVASPLAQQFTAVSAGTAALIVSLISLFNGAGRLVWAWLSDLIGRPFTFLAIYIVEILAFLFAAQIHAGGFGLLLIPAALIGLGYGGGFGTMPAFTADFFGAKNSGTIYGVMLTAWAAGGIVGPILIAHMAYRSAMYVLAVILLVSCIFPILSLIISRRALKSDADQVEVVAGAVD